MLWRWSKKASRARPRRSSLSWSADRLYSTAAPERSAQAATLTKATGLDSRAASSSSRTCPWDRCCWGSGGRWRLTMAAISRRSSKGLSRASGPMLTTSSATAAADQSMAHLTSDEGKWGTLDDTKVRLSEVPPSSYAPCQEKEMPMRAGPDRRLQWPKSTGQGAEHDHQPTRC